MLRGHVYLILSHLSHSPRALMQSTRFLKHQLAKFTRAARIFRNAKTQNDPVKSTNQVLRFLRPRRRFSLIALLAVSY